MVSSLTHNRSFRRPSLLPHSRRSFISPVEPPGRSAQPSGCPDWEVYGPADYGRNAGLDDRLHAPRPIRGP
jgi:hypothetical protein